MTHPTAEPDFLCSLCSPWSLCLNRRVGKLSRVTPACPRCGYDLSGAIATWHDACPLSGLCSECGLIYEWTDIHNPDRNRVRGFFEHARGPWQCGRWLELTWLMTLWPPRFWRKVRLETTVVPARAVAWIFLLIITVWIAGSLLCNAAALSGRYIGSGPPSRASTNQLLAVLANGWLSPPASLLEGPPKSWSLYKGGQWFYVKMLTPLAAATLAWPLLLVLLPQTMRAAKIRRAHVLRAACYSLAWIPGLAGLHLADGLSMLAEAVIDPSAYSGQRNGLTESASWYVSVNWPQALVLLTAWVFFWWHSALRTGFRLRSGDRIWWTLALASSLVWLLALVANGGLSYLIVNYGLV